MITLKSYLAYARAPFSTAAMMPVIFGTALAFAQTGRLSVLNFALAFIGMVLAQFSMNMLNDYHDFRQGADQGNRFRNLFSGGAPFIVTGQAEPSTIRNLGLATLGLAGVCGFFLMMRVDGGIGPVFWLMVLGALGGYFYTAPPFKFVYRGLGEIFIFFCFGLGPVLGVYYLHTGALSWLAAFTSVPIGLLIVNVLFINQFPDYESDKAAGKKTLVVILGLRRSVAVYTGIWLAAGVFIILGPLVSSLSWYYWLGLAGLVPAALATGVLAKNHADPPKVFPGQGLTIIAHLAASLLAALGVLL